MKSMAACIITLGYFGLIGFVAWKVGPVWAVLIALFTGVSVKWKDGES